MAFPDAAFFAVSPAGYYGLGGPYYSPPSSDFIGVDALPAFTPAIWNPVSGDMLPFPFTAQFSIGISVLTSRDYRNGNYFDGANGTTVFISPGSAGSSLQYQINGDTPFIGDYSGTGTPVSLLGYVDYQNVLVAVNLGSSAIVTTISLVSNAITGDVIYSKDGATDYYLDFGGNYWYLVGGVWGSDTADAALVPTFNTYFNKKFDDGFTNLYFICDGKNAIVGPVNSADTNAHWYTAAGEQDFPPYMGVIDDTAYYGIAGYGYFTDAGFYTLNLNFDGANFASLLTSVVTYGIAGGDAPPPPPPPEWTPPKPVPPYVPPDPGRIIPPRNMPTYNLTNISHETSGNY